MIFTKKQRKTIFDIIHESIEDDVIPVDTILSAFCDLFNEKNSDFDYEEEFVNYKP